MSWGLGSWNEYIVVREPQQPNSYLVLAHPADQTDFAERLIDFHKAEVESQ